MERVPVLTYQSELQVIVAVPRCVLPSGRDEKLTHSLCRIGALDDWVVGIA